jgi:hypothetical protein
MFVKVVGRIEGSFSVLRISQTLFSRIIFPRSAFTKHFLTFSDLVLVGMCFCFTDYSHLAFIFRASWCTNK